VLNNKIIDSYGDISKGIEYVNWSWLKYIKRANLLFETTRGKASAWKKISTSMLIKE